MEEEKGFQYYLKKIFLNGTEEFLNLSIQDFNIYTKDNNIGIVDIIGEMKDYFQGKKEVEKVKALRVIHAKVLEIDNLNIEEINIVIQFSIEKIDNALSTYTALLIIQILLTKYSFLIQNSKLLILQDILLKLNTIHLLNHEKETMLIIMDIYDKILSLQETSRNELVMTFEGFLNIIVDIKLPSILLQVLKIISKIGGRLTQAEFEKFEKAISELITSYFPIQFPQELHKNQAIYLKLIEELKEELLLSFTCKGSLAKFVIPFLFTKVDAPQIKCKTSTIEALIYCLKYYSKENCAEFYSEIMKIFKKEFEADIIEDKTLCIEGFALIYSKKLTNDQFIEKLTKYHKRLSKFEDPKKNKIELILKQFLLMSNISCSLTIRSIISVFLDDFLRLSTSSSRRDKLLNINYILTFMESLTKIKNISEGKETMKSIRDIIPRIKDFCIELMDEKNNFDSIIQLRSYALFIFCYALNSEVFEFEEIDLIFDRYSQLYWDNVNDIFQKYTIECLTYFSNKLKDSPLIGKYFTIRAKDQIREYTLLLIHNKGNMSSKLQSREYMERIIDILRIGVTRQSLPFEELINLSQLANMCLPISCWIQTLLIFCLQTLANINTKYNKFSLEFLNIKFLENFQFNNLDYPHKELFLDIISKCYKNLKIFGTVEENTEYVGNFINIVRTTKESNFQIYFYIINLILRKYGDIKLNSDSIAASGFYLLKTTEITNYERCKYFSMFLVMFYNNIKNDENKNNKILEILKQIGDYYEGSVPFDLYIISTVFRMKFEQEDETLMKILPCIESEESLRILNKALNSLLKYEIMIADELVKYNLIENILIHEEYTIQDIAIILPILRHTTSQFSHPKYLHILEQVLLFENEAYPFLAQEKIKLYSKYLLLEDKNIQLICIRNIGNLFKCIGVSQKYQLNIEILQKLENIEIIQQIKLSMHTMKALLYPLVSNMKRSVRILGRSILNKWLCTQQQYHQLCIYN